MGLTYGHTLLAALAARQMAATLDLTGPVKRRRLLLLLLHKALHAATSTLAHKQQRYAVWSCT